RGVDCGATVALLLCVRRSRRSAVAVGRIRIPVGVTTSPRGTCPFRWRERSWRGAEDRTVSARALRGGSFVYRSVPKPAGHPARFRAPGLSTFGAGRKETHPDTF